MKKYLPVAIFFAVAITSAAILHSASQTSTPSRNTKATGNTYYVSPKGGGNTCSSGSPCTLDAGLKMLKGGDTLILQAGTYNQRMTIPGGKGGTSDSNRTVIRVADGAAVTIRGAELNPYSANENQWITLTGEHGKLVFDGQYGPNAAIICNYVCSNIKMKDFEVTGSPDNGIGAGGDNNQYINLNVHHNGIKPNGTSTCGYEGRGYCHGTYFGGANVLIDGGEYHHNEGFGIHRTEKGQINWTVRNARLYNNSSGALIFVSGDHTLYNNLVYNNLPWGQGTSASSGNWGGFALAGNNKVYNNTIVGNSGGTGILASTGNEITNNILYGNGTNIKAEGTIANNLESDPKFVNAQGGDFRLLNGSPAIDAGMTLPDVKTDADGNTRPAGGAYDIGAYEFGAIGASPKAKLKVPRPSHTKKP